MLSEIVMTLKGLILLFGATELFSRLVKPEDAKWLKGTPRALFLSLFLIGMWGGNVWTLYIAIFLAMAFVPKNRPDAAAIFVIITLAAPLLSHKVYAGSSYIFQFTRYIVAGLGLGVAWLIKPASGIGAPRAGRHFDVPILILFGLEVWQSRDPKISEMLREIVPAICYLLLPYYCISRSLRTAQDVRRFVLAMAFGGFVLAVVAFVEWRLHWLIYKHIETVLHVEGRNPYFKTRGGAVRSPASFGESTSLALFLAMATLTIIIARDRFRSRNAWFVALLGCAAGLVAANSRGGFLGLALGVLALDLYRRRYGPLLVKSAACAGLYLCLLAGAQFFPFIADMIGKGGSSTTVDYRVELFRRGMQVIQSHPLLGQTVQRAMSSLEDLRQGEHIIDLVNGYIRYGLAAGYTGIVLILFVFLSLCGVLWIARRRLLANPLSGNVAALVFAISFFSIASTMYTNFGSAWSVPFYEFCALGSAVLAMRATAVRDGDSPGSSASGMTSIQQMIAADRERARGGRANRPAHVTP